MECFDNLWTTSASDPRPGARETKLFSQGRLLARHIFLTVVQQEEVTPME